MKSNRPILRFGGSACQIKYRPAWLGKVVEEHLSHHGEEYYDEGKSLRTHLENALLVAKRSMAAPNAVHELAAVSRLLKVPKRSVKGPKKSQLDLF